MSEDNMDAIKSSNKRLIIKLIFFIFVVIGLIFVLCFLQKKYDQDKYDRLQLKFRESIPNYTPDFDEEKYDKEKEALHLMPSEPVTDYGIINVNGNNYYLGMTMKEVIDFGYPYHEWLNEEDGSGLASLSVFYDRKDEKLGSTPMINCTFCLIENSDKSSYEDYELTSMSLNYVDSSKFYSERISYNAEIIYGIQTDMTYQEIMEILEPYEDQIKVQLLSDAGPLFTMKLYTDNYVYVFKFREMHLLEISLYYAEDKVTIWDRILWKLWKLKYG